MKLTNGEIFQSQQGLQMLLASKWPVKTSFKLMQTSRKISEAFKVVAEARDGLIKSHGTMDPATKNWSVASPAGIKRADFSTAAEYEAALVEVAAKWEAFSADNKALMEIEVEVDVEVVKLPEKIASTCDKCHHNMDRQYEIEPNVLILVEKLVEIA